MIGHGLVGIIPSSYGTDSICEEARALIRRLCAAPNADVHFLVGGTQTNLLVITSPLKPYEAVMDAHTGHINCHETGAIEATDHKVCTAFSPDGKVTPDMIERVLLRTMALSTWFLPEWFTSPTAQKSVQSTQNPS